MSYEGFPEISKVSRFLFQTQTATCSIERKTQFTKKYIIIEIIQFSIKTNIFQKDMTKINIIEFRG